MRYRQPAEEADELFVHVGEAQLDQGVLAGPLAQLLDLRLAALVGVLDPLRVDAAVGNETFQGQPADLAPHRVEAGQEHRFRGVIDDEVDTGHRLEGADVTALAADDAALHLVPGQVQDGDDGLAGLLGGHALDGQRDDLAGPLLAFRPGLVLDVPDDERRFPLGLVLDRGDELALGRIRGEPGDPLEFPGAVGIELVQVGGAPVEVLLALAEGLRAILDALELIVEPLLTVGETGFPALEVTAQLADLVLDRADLFLDLTAALGGLLGFLLSSLEDSGGLGLGPGADVLGFGGDAVELAAVYGLDFRCAWGPSPHHDEREYRREQPDHHERERQSAAHGHPFPSIALGAPLCCYRLVFGTGVYAPMRAVARRLRPPTAISALSVSLTTQRILLLLLRMRHDVGWDNNSLP